MKVAYLLPGFIRKMSYLGEIQLFLDNNKNHQIDLYSSTYDVVGSPHKEKSNYKGYIGSANVSKELLERHLPFEKIDIEEYTVVNNELDDFVQQNIAQVKPCVPGAYDSFSRKMRCKENDQTNFRRTYAQWRKVYRTFCLIDQHYDIVLRSRYDVKIRNLILDDYKHEANTIYFKPRGPQHFFKLDNGQLLEIPWDTVAFGNLDSMGIYCNLGKQENFLSLLEDEDFKSKHFFQLRNISMILNSEACISYWCHHKHGLKKTHIQNKHMSKHSLLPRNKF